MVVSLVLKSSSCQMPGSMPNPEAPRPFLAIRGSVSGAKSAIQEKPMPVRFAIVWLTLALAWGVSAARAEALSSDHTAEYTPIEQAGAPAKTGTFRVASLIEQECALWSKACQNTCEDKYPRSPTNGGAVIGGVAYTARQRGMLIGICRGTCMTNYPICK
jgi:hypothetical protein